MPGDVCYREWVAKSFGTSGMMGTGWIDVQAWALRWMDALAARWGGQGGPAHLVTGERGEREALFYLREAGLYRRGQAMEECQVVGDVDLIGWDGDRLCFVEVKTRSGRDAIPAEMAVDRDKQMLRRMARASPKGFQRS